MLDEDRIWVKVFLQDIYYIETVKSTHYCEVVSKNGVGKLHADITPLHRELNNCFFKSRSSTLVNLELVQKIDLGKRMLYFADDIHCTYAEKVKKDLKRLLKIRNYRN